MKVIFCVGISGSGKSTWATRYIKTHPNTIRVNRDDIRVGLMGTLDGYYKRDDVNRLEKAVTEIEIAMFQMAARLGFDVISDNTNLKMSYISTKISMLRGYCEDMGEPFDFKIKMFYLDGPSCKKRVQSRDSIFNDDYVAYIDKQWVSFQNIEREINLRWKNKMIEEPTN